MPEKVAALSTSEFSHLIELGLRNNNYLGKSDNLFPFCTMVQYYLLWVQKVYRVYKIETSCTWVMLVVHDSGHTDVSCYGQNQELKLIRKTIIGSGKCNKMYFKVALSSTLD